MKNRKHTFCFLKYILNYFNVFNITFKAHKSRVHLLQPKSLRLLSDMLKHFLKSALLKHLNEIRNIVLTEPSNCLNLKDINLGSECNEFLVKLVCCGQLEMVETIRQKCLAFYIETVNEILKCLPIDDEFFSNLQVLALGEHLHWKTLTW